MSVKTRHNAMLDALRELGSTSLESLAERFGVTLQTVRRDAQQLAQSGQLVRFHGGVRLPISTTQNIGYGQRQAMQAQAKARIAQAVAKQVPNHCSLILNIGTTTEAVAKALLAHQGLRVITNNLNVAATLADKADFDVVVTGGSVRSTDHGIVGETAVDFMRLFKADIAIIGISAIELDGSLRDFDYREVKVARAIIEHARSVWVVADHSKFGRQAMVHQARLDEVDAIFTDVQPGAAYVQLLAEAGVSCVVAP